MGVIRHTRYQRLYAVFSVESFGIRPVLKLPNERTRIRRKTELRRAVVRGISTAETEHKNVDAEYRPLQKRASDWYHFKGPVNMAIVELG